MPDSITPIDPSEIERALARIAPYLHRTPLMESHLLNAWLGHRVIFKCEMFQKIGAYKSRGALNALLKAKEKGHLPNEVVAFSSGNHAQAVARAAAILGINATIYVPENSSPIKRLAAESYGATVVLTSSRAAAEEMAEKAETEGKFLLPPYDSDDVIAGQGTVCLEALEDMEGGGLPDAIFTPVGGGGLLSGTFLAAKLRAPNAEVYAGEPKLANDAAISYKTGSIFRFEQTPDKTIADGARTLGIAKRSFHYIRQTNGIFEIEEKQIIYWTQWIMHLLKVTVEPSSALSMAAAFEWLKKLEKSASNPAQNPFKTLSNPAQNQQKTVLVLLSGGNISAETYQKIWKKSYLENHPQLQRVSASTALNSVS